MICQRERESATISEIKRTMFRFTIFQLLLSAFWLNSAEAQHDCDFGDGKLREISRRSQNAHLLIEAQLPPSRTSTHSCLLKSKKKDSFLRVKAKKSGETGGKYSLG